MILRYVKDTERSIQDERKIIATQETLHNYS